MRVWTKVKVGRLTGENTEAGMLQLRWSDHRQSASVTAVQPTEGVNEGMKSPPDVYRLHDLFCAKKQFTAFIFLLSVIRAAKLTTLIYIYRANAAHK